MIDRSTLRVALRTLRRHKGFTTVAILSLAVAIALNTVMYSVLDAMIDPRINAKSPDNVYEFWYYGNFRRQLTHVTIENALRAGMRENVADLTGAVQFRSWQSGQIPLAENGPRYKRVWPVVVRVNYFNFIGTVPLEGRTFLPSDEKDGNPVAVISNRLAQSLFPDESPVGRTLNLDGRGFTVIGVVERSPAFSPLSGDLWMLRQEGASIVPVSLIRLVERSHPYDLDKLLDLAAARLALAIGEKTSATGFNGRAVLNRKFKPDPFHLALIGGVAAVLLVACANLANLQLARGLARSRELALRAAVGGSRGQLIRLLVLESGLLALAGLVLGVVLTLWGIKLVGASIPDSMEFGGYFVQPQTSWSMFAFAALAALLCLFLVGLVPALQVSRVDPNDLLKSGAGTGASRTHRRRYGLMVVAQIGFALPVLIGAIIVLKSTAMLHSPDYWIRNVYGFNPMPLVGASIPYYGTTGQTIRAADVASEFTSIAKLVPGVIEASALVQRAPLKNAVTVDGPNGDMREEMAHQWSYNVVWPSFLRTYGRTMERGRDFQDGELSGNVVIVDSRTAKFLWKNDDAVGRSIKFGPRDADLPWHKVIGVVGDLRDTIAIRRSDPYAGFRLSQLYRVMSPQDTLNGGRYGYGTIGLTARVSGNTELAAVRLQRQLRAFRPKQPPGVIPMISEYGLGIQRDRNNFVASLFSTFAFLGLCLVAIGVFGIVSHSVAERRRELAVRISLGATARDILHSVLREGDVLILAGVALGLLLTKYTIFWLGAFIGSDDGYNAILMAFIAMLLFGLAAFAAFIPAWRATRIDPVEALRSE